MKIFNRTHTIIGCTILSILLSSCATMSPSSRTSVATQSGAIVGGTFGAALGDHIGGHNGSFWGSMIGSVAGIAAGAAASSAYNNHANKQVSRVDRQPMPSLVIRDIMLKDQNGDQCINANEHCQIIFIIENDGDCPAENVTPYLKAKGNAKKIQLSAPKSIHRITRKDKISYTVQAYGTEKLKSGLAEFEITLKDENKNELFKETFTVNTIGY
ncbi:MAG: hypothetical protein Q4A54_03955 [Parabacteroides sp.]|nr:hypothetical protein [Parabacteroides sp.]